MDFITLAKNRYSCRRYKDQPVEKEKLDVVLEAGRVAPSAVNYQPWVFVVIKDENVSQLRECYHREWFETANTYIVICVDHSQSWKRYDHKDHADIDAAIAADHMTLAATSLGLATCWVCNFDKDKLVNVIQAPNNLEPVVILPIGYPEDEAKTERHNEKRKKMEEIVFYEHCKK